MRLNLALFMVAAVAGTGIATVFRYPSASVPEAAVTLMPPPVRPSEMRLARSAFRHARNSPIPRFSSLGEAGHPVTVAASTDALLLLGRLAILPGTEPQMASIRQREVSRLIGFRVDAQLAEPQWQRFLQALSDLVSMEQAAQEALTELMADDRVNFSLELGSELERRLVTFLTPQQMELFRRRFAAFDLLDGARVFRLVSGAALSSSSPSRREGEGDSR